MGGVNKGNAKRRPTRMTTNDAHSRVCCVFHLPCMGRRGLPQNQRPRNQTHPAHTNHTHTTHTQAQARWGERAVARGMASTQPIWAGGYGGGGGGFGATGQGSGGEPVETLLVGQTRLVLFVGFGLFGLFGLDGRKEACVVHAWHVAVAAAAAAGIRGEGTIHRPIVLGFRIRNPRLFHRSIERSHLVHIPHTHTHHTIQRCTAITAWCSGGCWGKGALPLSTHAPTRWTRANATSSRRS
jgi:hypothetical protein